MIRYLFGPVTESYAREYLARAREQGDCLAFNAAGDLDLAVRGTATWDDVRRQLPSDCQPDCVFLYLPYTVIPTALWSAPVPIIGVAPDWNLCWHWYRHCLPCCDAILTDRPGADVMRKQGIGHAYPANLFGLGRSYFDQPPPQVEKTVDLVFAGNLHWAVQRERLKWLGRAARLSDRWRVEIRQGVFGEEYRRLLAQARIVMNYGVRSEANMRVFESVAAGALLFQEASNTEVGDYLHEDEYVRYDDGNLERSLDYYLEHENERRQKAEAARSRLQDFSFESLWQRHLAVIERDWPQIVERAKARSAAHRTPTVSARLWQSLSSEAGDPSLSPLLAQKLVSRPNDADVHNGLGLLTRSNTSSTRPAADVAHQAVGYFRRAVACDATHAVAGLNLAEALAASGQTEAAAQQARQTLALLEEQTEPTPTWLDSGHFPVAYDTFRVAWEKAAWGNAGEPTGETAAKRTLLRWRLHSLLAELTGDLAHAYEAVVARPDLPESHSRLGTILSQAKRPADALPHLRHALGVNPFDVATARQLFQSLGDANDGPGQRRLARDYRLLLKAAPAVIPAEAWITKVPPAGDELASIIILCCDQVDFTRQCLESVLAHTRTPYELILIDNGSLDDTPYYLEEIKGRAGPARVVVVRNQANRGFPAGCNQGFAHSRGQYLVFLNNDTIVTESWLEGLINWSLTDWPNVGLVGAVTNYSRPPQQIPVDYRDLPNMPAFAARRRREFAGQALPVDRLTGFCLLARREVLAQVGGFDERFGVGFFDDDDLSVRVHEAGFRLLVAQDVFVHHFGSRTFTGLGVDCTKQLRDNFEQFKAKWGPEHCAGYRPLESPAAFLPSPSGRGAAGEGLPLPSPSGRGAGGEGLLAATPHEPPHPNPLPKGEGTGVRPRVSLCMMVKNEEDNLPACLEGTEDLFFERIIIDTGSTDRTKEVAERHGGRVYDFPWCDSFSAARNEGLRQAKGDWVFWLDADDRLDEQARQRLRELFASLADESVAFSMKCLCLPDPVTNTATVVDHVRLFRNDPAVRWTYRVHEQILPALRQSGTQIRWADVVIRHVGYQDPALRKKKLQRDLRLLQIDHTEHPDDPFILFNLGCISQELGRLTEAIPLLKRSLELSHPSDSIVRKLFALIVQCHRHLGQHAEALAMCESGRKYYPEDIELLFQEGLARRELRDFPGSERCFVRLLTNREASHFGSVDTGLRGYKTRQNLGQLYFEQGRDSEAEAQWRAALSEQPQFGPAWIGLGELFLSQRRWAELDEAVTHLNNGACLPLEAQLLRGRGYLARGELGPARQTFEQAVAAFPAVVAPRVLLTHALLQEGHDFPAAEHALRGVLELDPVNAEAHQNLGVLLRRVGRPDEAQVATQRAGLSQLFRQVCHTPSDIHEHCPTLHALARKCRRVTEMGTRTAVSTTALLAAQPDSLVCYDRARFPQVDTLAAVAGTTRFAFHQADVLQVEIEETDLLFIDTWHVYEQLKEELRRHGAKAKRYIVLHDTTTFGEQGESEGHRGLWPAVEEFLAQGTFRLKARYANNNGLTILEAVDGEAEPQVVLARATT